MSGTGDRKTAPTTGDVAAYLDAVTDERRRADAAGGGRPHARGDRGTSRGCGAPRSIGFGRQPYRTADGKEREWFAVGLAPRKAALTLYGLTYYGSNTDLLERLGPHTTGKGCLYVKRLDGRRPRGPHRARPAGVGGQPRAALLSAPSDRVGENRGR